MNPKIMGDDGGKEDGSSRKCDHGMKKKHFLKYQSTESEVMRENLSAKFSCYDTASLLVVPLRRSRRIH